MVVEVSTTEPSCLSVCILYMKWSYYHQDELLNAFIYFSSNKRWFLLKTKQMYVRSYTTDSTGNTASTCGRYSSINTTKYSSIGVLVIHCITQVNYSKKEILWTVVIRGWKLSNVQIRQMVIFKFASTFHNFS